LKTIRISDDAHRELTRLLGEAMAKTGKAQTYCDVVDALTKRTVILPAELLEKIDAAVNGGKHFKAREDLVEKAVTAFLQKLGEQDESKKR
jgi:predicted CopG family antitoxin